jgi:hypothetical protein
VTIKVALSDMDNGLTLTTLINSNLCSEIMVLVAIKYVSKTSEMVVVDKGSFFLDKHLFLNFVWLW